MNAGQVGGVRAAEYIANVYGAGVNASELAGEVKTGIATVIAKLDRWLGGDAKRGAREVIAEIQQRMTSYGGHIRELVDARQALQEAVALHREVLTQGLKVSKRTEMIAAVQAEHLALMSAASLKAIVTLLEQGSGSRGSHLVLSDDGVEVHRDVLHPKTGAPLRFKPENEALRDSILRVSYAAEAEDLFTAESVARRAAPTERKAFEPAWADYREGKIFD